MSGKQWIMAGFGIILLLVFLVIRLLLLFIMIPAAIAAGHGNPVALAFCIAAGSEYAFSLPSATTSTAIVTGSGWVPPMFMIKYGVLLILPIVLLFTYLIYPLSAIIFR